MLIFEYHCAIAVIDLVYPHETKIGHFAPLCTGGNGFQKFLIMVDICEKTDILIIITFWLCPFFDPRDLKKEIKIWPEPKYLL